MQSPWRWIDAALEAILWGWDMLMMYVAALLLIPLCVIASLKLLGVATIWSELAEAGPENVWMPPMLLGAPAWLALTLYARFSGAPRAAQLRRRLERLKWAVIWATCAAMAMFAALALLLRT